MTKPAMQQYWFVCYAYRFKDSDLFVSDVIKEHPFIEIATRRKKKAATVTIISFQQITYEDYKIFLTTIKP